MKKYYYISLFITFYSIITLLNASNAHAFWGKNTAKELTQEQSSCVKEYTKQCTSDCGFPKLTETQKKCMNSCRMENREERQEMMQDKMKDGKKMGKGMIKDGRNNIARNMGECREECKLPKISDEQREKNRECMSTCKKGLSAKCNLPRREARKIKMGDEYYNDKE